MNSTCSNIIDLKLTCEVIIDINVPNTEHPSRVGQNVNTTEVQKYYIINQFVLHRKINYIYVHCIHKI